MPIRWLTMSLWGRRVFLLEAKKQRTHISAQAELLQFIQCPGGKLLCDLSSASSVSEHLAVIVQVQTSSSATDWHILDPSDMPLILVPACACPSLSCPVHPAALSHGRIAFLSTSWYTRRCNHMRIACYRLGMLAVWARGIDRDASVFARGGSKEGSERANQIRGTLAIWI